MREATTDYVILGVLSSAGPMSGYELRQSVARNIGYFWSESYGQIYPALGRLRRRRLVAPVAETGRGGRARQRYRVLPEGRRALRAWLRRPARPQPVRVESLLKIYFGAETGDRACREHVEQVLRDQQARSALFTQAGTDMPGEHASEPTFVYQLLTLRFGQLVTAARVQWAYESQALLDAHARGGSGAVLAAWRRLTRAPAAVHRPR